MHIAGKTALVTGAGGALGSAMVQMLLQHGAKTIIALDKNAETLKALQSPHIIPIACDAADPEALEQSLLPVFDAQKIDILINNAGILHSAPLVQMLRHDSARFAEGAAAWRQVIEANLSSAFYVTQLVADHMTRARVKGVIINMSSLSAQGTAGQSAYAASKAGLNALVSVWSKELGMLGIRSVAIAPGYIDTPSTHKALTEAQLQSITERVPLKTLGSADHIIQAVRFAIENDYVNGTVIEVDGGLCV